MRAAGFILTYQTTSISKNYYPNRSTAQLPTQLPWCLVGLRGRLERSEPNSTSLPTRRQTSRAQTLALTRKHLTEMYPSVPPPLPSSLAPTPLDRSNLQAAAAATRHRRAMTFWTWETETGGAVMAKMTVKHGRVLKKVIEKFQFKKKIVSCT